MSDFTVTHNSGKTLIGLRLMYELKLPTAIFVHQKTIADQWVEKIQEILGVDPAICYGGTRENGDIQVCLYQSVYDDDAGVVRDDVRLDHDVIMPDEAHRVAASTFSSVTLSCTAAYRYGFTATPDREDNATLRILGGTGPVIADLSAEKLIEAGYLAEPEWRILEGSKAGGNYRTWQDEYQAEIVENDRRNRMLADVVADLERPTLVTVERIAHGERLQSMIDGAAFIHGNKSDRDDLVQAFRDGEVPVLIGTRGIVGEGFDVPEIWSMCIAGGLKSSTSMIQQAGRALRPGDDGKATLVDVLDHGRWVGQHSDERVRAFIDYYGDYGPP